MIVYTDKSRYTLERYVYTLDGRNLLRICQLDKDYLTISAARVSGFLSESNDC